MALDSQQVELIGRNLLISQLVFNGLEVAVPTRDRGVDLIVYSDREEMQPGAWRERIGLQAPSDSAPPIERDCSCIHNQPAAATNLSCGANI